MKCSQVKCEALAAARFYWPGGGWRNACPEHGQLALKVADAMGFAITLEPLDRAPPSADEPPP